MRRARFGSMCDVKRIISAGSGERIVPPRRDAPVAFDLPQMETARDAASVAGAVLAAVAIGDLTPTEGAHVMGLIETYRRTLETTELEARIAALEGGTNGA